MGDSDSEAMDTLPAPNGDQEALSEALSEVTRRGSSATDLFIGQNSKLPHLQDNRHYLPVQCSLLSSIGFSVYLMTQLELNGPSKVTWLSQWWRHRGVDHVNCSGWS